MLNRRKNNSMTYGRFRIIKFAFLLTVTIGVIVAFFPNPHAAVISPLPEDPTKHSSVLNLFKKEKDPDTLKKSVTKIIGSNWKNYSVYVADYKSKFTMGINESTIFTAASINKIPILTALYAGAKNGTIDFDKIITLQTEDIQDYGTGSIRYDPPGTTYSIKTLVRLMMQKSDNTAAYLLANYIVGLDQVQTYINTLGLTQTDMINNKTSNKDMALLFEKIYNKKITSSALSEEMLGFLTDSDFEDRLPALLPKEARVYHKIGTGTGAVHDVGIIVWRNITYYIGIFTSDILDEEQAATLVSEVSKSIFDFMSSN